MKKLLVHITWSGDNYCAHSDIVLGCITTGHSIEEVKCNYAEALELHREGIEEGEELPDWVIRGDYEFEYELAVPALLKHYSAYISLSAIGRAAGIRPKQMSHYLNGVRVPRTKRREDIVSALHRIGAELSKAK